MIYRGRVVTQRITRLPAANFSKGIHAERISKPKASEVLTAYLEQTHEPPWTSYFVKHMDVVNDQYGMSHFNWQVGGSNYTVLRVGCFPFIKYHCTRGPYRDLSTEDKFFRFIKVANLGIPCLMYGIAALFLIRHKELVHLKNTTQEGRDDGIVPGLNYLVDALKLPHQDCGASGESVKMDVMIHSDSFWKITGFIGPVAQ